jgi:hypothetical protein
VVAATTKQGAWLAAGPIGHLEWMLLGSLFVGAQVGPTFRLTTDRFYFLPDTTAYHVPVAGADLEAGIGVLFL